MAFTRSLLIDGSTDQSQDHVAVILFQYVASDGTITTQFYKLIKIGLDESATGYLIKIQQAMKNDNIWEAARQRMVAVVSGKIHSLFMSLY